jgi:hypothetical protein
VGGIATLSFDTSKFIGPHGACMNASDAQTIFEQRLTEANTRVENVSVADGFDLMFAFYREERADDCPQDADGDMLLYEWGTYDWGQGEFFEIGLTRQFILDGTSDDENIWQLSLRFKFKPDDALRQVGSGERWCDSPQKDHVDELELFVSNSSPFRTVANRRAASVELTYQCAG